MTEEKAKPSISIRNFHQVTPWLYRGGQPTEEGFHELVALGVKTVISFRGGSGGNRAEAKACQSLNLRYISMPLNYWTLPSYEKIGEFLKLLDEDERRPFFVHCFHGADRTGIMVAMYRVARENWPVDKAYFEMKKCGFHRIRIRHYKWALWSHAKRAVRELSSK